MRPKTELIRLSVLLLLAPLVACGTKGTTGAQEEAATPSGDRNAEALATLSPYGHDAEVVATLSQHSSAWNQTTGLLVRDYLDPTISAESWVESANDWLGTLREIMLKMRVAEASFENKEVREIFSPLIQSYKRKLDAVTFLHLAVAKGDPDAESAALNELRQAADEARELGLETLDLLREYIDPEEVDAILEERAEAAAKAME